MNHVEEMQMYEKRINELDIDQKVNYYKYVNTFGKSDIEIYFWYMFLVPFLWMNEKITKTTITLIISIIIFMSIVVSNVGLIVFGREYYFVNTMIMLIFYIKRPMIIGYTIYIIITMKSVLEENKIRINRSFFKELDENEEVNI